MSASSAYIHIPFCVRKCAYCDFLSFPDCAGRMDAYVAALCREIRLAPKLAWPKGSEEETETDADGETDVNDQADANYQTDAKPVLHTIYFGGGTPSMLSGEQVAAILGALREVFDVAADCEITLEANPGTIDQMKLGAFYEAGVNRISLGIQSLDDSVLQTLGRIHDAEAARQAITMVKQAGFTNISCDMMLGIPGQTLESVQDTVQYILSKNIPHVSLYSLILEEGTPMYTRYDGDIEKFVSQEQDREMYHEVIRLLSERGFNHYEISNMARPGYESRHNMMYWRAEEYYGFGVGAHYYLGDERGRHVETVDAYLSALGETTGLYDEVIGRETVYIPEETLTKEDCMKEFMMLGFRMGSGVNQDMFQKRFGVKVESAFANELKAEIEKGLVEPTDSGYQLTEKGFDLANQVFEDYV